MPMNKQYIILLTILIILLSQTGILAAQTPIQLTGEIRYIQAEDGLYGIVGDNGIKYQPINLPREFRKNGLPIKFIAENRDDLFTPINWGTTIKIKTIEKIDPTILQPERTAIYILSKRMSAFNNKDLTILQTIDMASKNLSEQQFADWIGNFSNFTLRYVEIASADSTTITGSCIYTREVANTMTLRDSDNITQLVFTLNLTKDGWKIVQSSSTKPLGALSTIKEQANLRYGIEDLATLWHY